MALYLTTIGVVVAILSGINIAYFQESFSYYNIWVVVVLLLCCLAEIAITATFSFLAELLPESWFYPKRKFFQISKREQKFYEFFGIKLWKNAICELGLLVGHNKRKFEKPSDPVYIQTFILECNRAMVGHFLDAAVGFIIIILLPLKYVWRVTFPIVMLSLVLNIIPAIIIRYNSPKLKVILKRARRNAQRNDEAEEVLSKG